MANLYDLSKRIFNKDWKTLEERSTPEELLEYLDMLATELSPENLCCDGELRGNALRKKALGLHKLWAECEAKLGRKVPIGEIENKWLEGA